MSIIAKLYIEDREINILKFSFSFNKNTDVTGRPSAKPTGGIFNIVFETIKDALFFEWMISENTIKNLKIVLSPSSMNSKSRTIELFDAYCLKHQENFDGVDNQPMMTYIQVSPAIMVQDGIKIFEWYWKVTDLSANVEPTTLTNNEEATILETYFEDKQGNKLNFLKAKQEIRFVLKTENMEGKSINADLSKHKVGFEHDGEVLESNILKDISISSGTKKVNLKTVKK